MKEYSKVEGRKEERMKGIKNGRKGQRDRRKERKEERGENKKERTLTLPPYDN